MAKRRKRGATKKKSAPKNDETKRQKFVRLCQHRMSVALAKLDMVGRLSRKASYEYDPEDVAKILGAIESKYKQLKALFSQEGPTSSSFQL